MKWEGILSSYIQNPVPLGDLPSSHVIFKEFSPFISNSADLLINKYNTALLASFPCFY